MSNVVRLQTPARPAPPAPYAQFCEARQAILTKLSAWLQSRPDQADIAAEIDGTVSALQQLAALAESAP